MLLWSDLMWLFDQIQQIQRLKCQEQIYEENQCISVHDKHKVHPDEYITTKMLHRVFAYSVKLSHKEKEDLIL